MRPGAAVFALVCSLLAAPVRAEGPYPPQTWEFTLEFRRMPMTPACVEKYGKGTLRQTGKGRNPTYVLTGFPAASVFYCRLPNGGAFEIDALRLFDLPDDGFWKGPVELMGPGDIQKVRARYVLKSGPFVDGIFWFDTRKGRFREVGGSEQMYQAITRGTRP